MTEIIKKDSNTPASHPAQSTVSKWPISKAEKNSEKYRRIIKSGEASFSPVKKNIPHMNMAPDSPVVKPIKKGIFVEGIEIICRCGEKIIVQFDLEENAEFR